jgi:hypothetical protein
MDNRGDDDDDSGCGNLLTRLPEQSIFGHPWVVSKTQCYITVSTQHTIRTLICKTCFDLYLNHSQVLITIKKTLTIQ